MEYRFHETSLEVRRQLLEEPILVEVKFSGVSDLVADACDRVLDDVSVHDFVLPAQTNVIHEDLHAA